MYTKYHISTFKVTNISENHIWVHDILSIKNVSKQMKNLICKTYDGLSTNL